MNDLMPREKALLYGISSLNNTELLALIIKSAYKNQNVFTLADEIISLANGFDNIVTLSYEELISIKGIKKAKALEIMAILEIAKRLCRIEKISQEQLSNPEKVVEWLRCNLAYANEEQFYVIFLNNKGNIIKSEILYRGNKNTSVVGIDEILRKAIIIKASYLIVAHNHPSDNVSPSKADINLTTRLNDSCSMMEIPLLDHLIVGKTSYFSFKNHNMLK